SSTSGQLASFAVNFSPANPAFTFTSFTNDVTITDLATPATIDNSSFTYDLVSQAAPEPSVWMFMIAGVGLTGAAMRRRRSVALAI
ncbi:MAG: PEPxxWA-CTERM sorting domain-containing protein, partial [Caulobacteraceae bacterium]